MAVKTVPPCLKEFAELEPSLFTDSAYALPVGWLSNGFEKQS